jgi:ketosteroid isomerase-like protein
MIPATFDPNIAINISLGSVAPTADAFGRPLILVDRVTNSLNGDRSAGYLTVAQAKAAKNAGYISAATLLMVTAAINQINSPAQGVLVGNVNTAGSESYGAGLLAVTADDPVFYLVVIDSHAAADIVSVANTVETMNDKAAAADAGYPFKYCFFVAQSSDATIKTGSLPGGLATLAGKEYTQLAYYSDDAVWFNAAHQGPLSANLSQSSPTWTYFPVKGIAAETGVTNDERVAMEAIYVDMALPMGNTTNGACVMGPGLTQANRQVPDVITAAWLATNLQIAIANMMVETAAVNQRITVTAAGQTAVVGAIQGVISTALQTGAILAADRDGNIGYVVTALPITDADIAAKRLRFTVAVLLPQSAQYVVVDITTSTTSVV